MKLILTTAVFIALFVITSCTSTEPIEKDIVTTPPSSIKPSSPIQATLSLSDKPVLNTPVTLTLSFKSATDAPNTNAKIELPDGFELVSGDLNWQGDLSADKEQKIEVIFKSTKVGYYQLKGSAISTQGSSYFGDNDNINIEITPTDAIIGSKSDNNWYGSEQVQATPLAENNEQIQSELIISQNPELNRGFTITYSLTPSIDIPDSQRTQMSLVFPPKAFEVVVAQFPEGGENYEYKNQLSWKGSINKGQTVEIRATFKITKTGWGPVYGHLNVQPSGEIANLISDAKIADLYVDKYTGNFKIKSADIGPKFEEMKDTGIKPEPACPDGYEWNSIFENCIATSNPQ